MNNKEEYEKFCADNYVPIYSKSWWMDAVCGANNWDVWLYKKGNDILAAMPYYVEQRGKWKYITKPPLTQNNGIIFKEDERRKPISQLKFEEEVIHAACEFINSLGIDVYEQQFQTTFTNWLPFFWEHYTAIERYTYVFENDKLKDLSVIWEEMDKKKRNQINKGNSNCIIKENLPPKDFYAEVEKTYAKQGLECPFSLPFWENLFDVVSSHNSGKIFYALNQDNIIASVIFVVWDERRMYDLIGGGDVELQKYEGKSALVWRTINLCAKMGLTYDFEGSVIKRISRSNRLFGAVPKPYFRIRKVFNPEIILSEARNEIKMLNEE